MPLKMPVWQICRLATVCAGSAALHGCWITAPHTDAQSLVKAGAQWEAPLPAAEAGQASSLSQWWAAWNDSTLTDLQARALQDNTSLAQAAARIAQARADAAAAGAALWPAVDFRAAYASTRSPLQPPPVKQTYAIGGLDARWEIDLFGAVENTRNGSLARVAARESEWQDARISLAAEVANTYVALRTCEIQQDIAQKVANSQALSQKLFQQRISSGFISAVELAQNSSLLATAMTQLQQQKTECAVTVKSLTVLTGIPEPELRPLLAAHAGEMPHPASFVVENMPAKVLLLRPDLRAAMQNLTAAASEIGVAEAKRYPSLSLMGSLGRYSFSISGQSQQGNSWFFGPVLDIPLFDAGSRKAAVDNATARYEEALAAFKQRTLLAVKEVEEAMLRLDAASQNLVQQQKIDEAREIAMQASEAGLKAGSYSVLEREEVKRQQLSGRQQKVMLQRDQASAWIALYKAVGGDWSAGTNAGAGKNASAE
ncbi:efflux transporter outer membrane subunit [Undibacterium sp. TJN25]|uniref:efflux transporter outer membrane subunit n=1 Tax=Undibacterium sp. TJN25 TaxID=3413056 RepID=UPI003BEFD509